jgi:hypothetical protein
MAPSHDSSETAASARAAPPPSRPEIAHRLVETTMANATAMQASYTKKTGWALL